MRCRPQAHADLSRLGLSDEATRVVEEQFAKAGYRLAYFLGLSLKN
jgi:hypothetical protein